MGCCKQRTNVRSLQGFSVVIQCKATELALTAALLLLLSSCAGLSAGGPRNPAQPSTAELQAQVLAMPAPADVRATSWRELTQALSDALALREVSNFDTLPIRGVTDLQLTGRTNLSLGLSFTHRLQGDYDGNGEPNAADLVSLARWLGTTQHDPDWEQARWVDGDGNGEINFADVTPIAYFFGQTVRAYAVEQRDPAAATWHRLLAMHFHNANVVSTGVREFQLELGSYSPGFAYRVVAITDPNLFAAMITPGSTHIAPEYEPNLPGLPHVPFSVSVSQTFTDRIEVSWEAVDIATSYQIYRDGQDELIATVDAPQTSYADHDVDSSMTHTYWVRAVNEIGSSPYSTGLTGRALIAAPSGLAASQGDHAFHVELSWDSVPLASQYRLQVSRGGVFEREFLLAADKLSFKDNGVVGQDPRDYRIQAQGGTGWGGYSAMAQGWLGEGEFPPVEPGDWRFPLRDPQNTARSAFVGPDTNNVRWTQQPYPAQQMRLVTEAVLHGSLGELYFRDQRWDVSTNLYLVNPGGSIRWELAMPLHQRYGRLAALTLDGGALYASTTSDWLLNVNSDKSEAWFYEHGSTLRSVQAFDVDDSGWFITHDELFRIDGTGNLAGSWPAPPPGSESYSPFRMLGVFNDGGVLFCTRETTTAPVFYAYNLDGTQRWSYQPTTVSMADAIIYPDDSVLLVGKALTRLDSTGGELWSFDQPQVTYGPATLREDGMFYVARMVSDSGEWPTFETHLDLRRLDGSVEWSEPITMHRLSALISDAAGNVYGGVQALVMPAGYKGASNVDPMPYTAGDVFSLDAIGEERWELSLHGIDPGMLSIGDDGALTFGAFNRLYCVGE